MPFLADQYDVVATRFAIHHMDDPAAALHEMARVCRPGGWMTVADLLDGGGDHNRLERPRDASHARALAREELEEAVAAEEVVPRGFPASVGHHDNRVRPRERSP
jgi:ubiquinone/menaquinone biosynthesis C-methylase UbiE